MTIEKTILESIDISRNSGVPVLYFSNPGYGKTTTINKWAKANNYHVESLIGSQFSQDEILGFQVNNNGVLEVLEPEWYRRIIKAKENGQPSVLFLDELSMCAPSTQGALLHLCFAKEIRGGKKLPEDCLVLAAANYKDNLPEYCEIIAPQINRFCVVNLDNKDKSPTDILMEFTSNFGDGKDIDHYIAPSFEANVDEAKIMSSIRKELASLFMEYNNPDNSWGYISLENQNISCAYEPIENRVYNFISGRTISYFTRIMKSVMTSNKKLEMLETVKLMAAGLIGGGTFSWDEDTDARNKQVKKFNSRISKMINKLVTEVDDTRKIKKEETVETSTLNAATQMFFRDQISVSDFSEILNNQQLDDVWLKNIEDESFRRTFIADFTYLMSFSLTSKFKTCEAYNNYMNRFKAYYNMLTA
jgi:hypothetical protein